MTKLTLPKQMIKRYRKVIVDEVLYAWKVIECQPGKTSGIGITVICVSSGTAIRASLEQENNYLAFYNSDGKASGGWVLTDKHPKITPAYIRKVILFALDHGWKKNSDFPILLNKKLPLQEHKTFEFPTLCRNEVVVVGYQRTEDSTLHVLNNNLKKFKGSVSFYKVFSSQVEAEEYMIRISSGNKKIEFWMTDSEEYALAKVNQGDVKYFNPK